MKVKGRELKGFEKYILMALEGEGPLSLEELDNKFVIFMSKIWYQQWDEKDKSILNTFIDDGERVRYDLKEELSRNNVKADNMTFAQVSSKTMIKELLNLNLVKENESNEYELTNEGHEAGKELISRMKKRAKTIDKNFFDVPATARNNIFLNALLAILKLSAGLISGSVGLLSDGLDAITDTISAFLVWLGIKIHHEFLSTILVIFMLFIAGFTAIYESITRILAILANTVDPITQIPLAVTVEAIAICISASLFVYQRHVGRANNNLTIISQSVDSKNHIFIGSAVIIGALFSMIRIYWVDAIVGLFIGAGILKDSIELAKDAKSSYDGEETDYTKYKTVFGNYTNINHMETCQLWILYAIPNYSITSKRELIESFEGAFNNRYIPILAELDILHPNDNDIEFKEHFDEIVNPLIERGWIKKEGNEEYDITNEGLKHLDTIFNDFNNYDVKFSDSFMLKLSDES